MRKEHRRNSLARRGFVVGGAAALAWPGGLRAQTMALKESPGLAERIAGFAAGFELAKAPLKAIETARTAFVDTVGVMLAGSTEKAAGLVRDMAQAEGAAPAVSVVGAALKTSPQLAALCNGVAGHALDFDFTYQQGQLMAPVIPALLPLAEASGANGAKVLAAFVAGFEVCSRLSRANPTHNGEGAWHGTSTIGTISTAVACAQLIKLPAEKYPDTIGIAVSMASGVNANYGTMTKPLHAGHAARNGMTAALLGGKGFSANHSALEGRGGFFATFARGIPWSAAPFDDLGQKFDLAENGIRPKRYPCGGVIHTGIDAALAIRDELGPRVSRHRRDQGRDHEIRREPRRHAVSEGHGGGEIQSAIRRGLLAGAWRAEACLVRGRSDRRSARQGAGRHGAGFVRSGVRRRTRRRLPDAAFRHAEGRPAPSRSS